MAVCRNNLHQWGIALQLYVTDFQVYPLLQVRTETTPRPGSLYKYERLERYTDTKWDVWHPGIPKSRPSGVHVCPSYLRHGSFLFQAKQLRVKVLVFSELPDVRWANSRRDGIPGSSFWCGDRIMAGQNHTALLHLPLNPTAYPLEEFWRDGHSHDPSDTDYDTWTVLTDRNPRDQHGQTSHLTREAIEDLDAYVLSLQPCPARRLQRREELQWARIQIVDSGERGGVSQQGARGVRTCQLSNQCAPLERSPF